MNTSEMKIPSIGVLLVDDHAIWRGGVRSMLNGTEFKVVGEAGSGRDALIEARRLHDNGTPPRLVLLDIRMAGGDGLDALVALKAEHCELAVVMLSTYDNPTYMAREADECVHPLSERELEVLRLLSTGLSNKEIAPILFISESTVKTHVTHIIAKLGVSDRVQAAVWAARRGVALLPTLRSSFPLPQPSFSSTAARKYPPFRGCRSNVRSGTLFLPASPPKALPI
jgi:DNA-binding NarL/FixJ family response regulator